MVQDVLESKGYTVVEMSRDDSGIDVIISKKINGRLTCCGVAEIKNRISAGNQQITVEYVRNGGYLITEDKLSNGSDISFMLSVPYFLIVNIVPDKKILIWKITDESGLFLFDFETKNTKTQMTCNGGTIVRKNSYLPIDKATILEY